MARIGVFICHCGHNIASTVNVEEVVEHAKTLPDVAYAGHNLYSCSEEGLGSIKRSITENNLDRVVVAACTPRTHEPLFRRACEQAGINKYLFEFVNIREHCSWIHAKEPKEATEKAKDLVRMALAKSRLLEPLENQPITFEPGRPRHRRRSERHGICTRACQAGHQGAPGGEGEGTRRKPEEASLPPIRRRS